MKDAHWELLAKYLANECSAEERKIAKEIINAERNTEIIRQASAIYESSILNDLNSEDSFLRLTRRLKNEKLL